MVNLLYIVTVNELEFVVRFNDEHQLSVLACILLIANMKMSVLFIWSSRGVFS